MGILYVVSTPIGNLEDVSYRTVRVLGQVGLILAEDTRVTRKLLSRYALRNHLLSFNDHNWRTRLPQALAALSQGDVALVSDAGTPVLSDPGYELVRAAWQYGYQVSPVPGPSAVTAAIAVAGLPGDDFRFAGFLPRRRPERRTLLFKLAAESCTLVLFEAPHRLQRVLPDLLEALGDRPVTVCRELTKVYEEVFRGTLSQVAGRFPQPLGEFTLVVAGAAAQPEVAQDAEAVRLRIGALQAQGMKLREGVAQVVAESRLPRRVVYRLWLDSRGRSPAGSSPASPKG